MIREVYWYLQIYMCTVYYILSSLKPEGSKTKVMFLPDSLDMTSLMKPWKDINVFVGFKSVSQDWKCINLFRGACKCWIIIFFRLIGLNETINSMDFLWFFNILPVSASSSCHKKDRQSFTPSNPEIHVTYIYICPLLIPSPNLFGSYSLSGIIKIPYTPWKINMEPENDGLEDYFPFQLGGF